MSSQNVPKMNSKAPSFKLKRHLKIKKGKRAKRMAGSICSSGIIRDLRRNGFTIFKSWLEALTNCSDAQSTKVCCIIDSNKRIEAAQEAMIYIVDNGNGMNMDWD